MSAAHQKAVLSRRQSVSSDAGAVAARAASEKVALGSATAATTGRHDIRRVALSASVNGRSRPVQRAMNVSQPGDPSEMEADRVADSVMRMQDAPSSVFRSAATVSREGEEEEEVQAKLADGVQPNLSRQAEVAREGEEEEEVATKRLDTVSREVTVAREGAEEEEEVATKRVSRSESADVENGGDVSHIVKQGLSGGGQPLDSASRAFFEPRLGHDLSNIRVHTGTEASASAEQVNARAYAVGGDIAFKSGEYNPGTSAGRHLIAHELTHTVQQGATTPLAPSRKAVSRRKKERR